MSFLNIAQTRQSCRRYDSTREVEAEKLERILEAARLAPSACNSQPYHVTVCRGEAARAVAGAVQGMGFNKFAPEAPLLLVLSEKSYSPTAAIGSKLKGNDYRSLDLGILAAYITAAATEEGLGSCILGWLNDADIRKICGLDGTVRMVITLGYAKEGDPLRTKKRKSHAELFSTLDKPVS